MMAGSTITATGSRASPAFAGTAMQDMVKDFHEQGIKVQLWWLPLAVEDGKVRVRRQKYVVSDVVKQHPDWLILDEHGQPARMTRNLATLCPALPEVRAYYKQLTERFIRDWDFDGHKLDNIYSVHVATTPSIITNPRSTPSTPWAKCTRPSLKPPAHLSQTA